MTHLISPLLWQSVPFRDPDAWLDFLGAHQTWHQVLAEQTQTAWQPMDDLRAQLEPHQQMHDALADAIGIPRAGDLQSFDLDDRDAYVGWQWIHALDHQRFRRALGI